MSRVNRNVRFFCSLMEADLEQGRPAGSPGYMRQEGLAEATIVVDHNGFHGGNDAQGGIGVS